MKVERVLVDCLEHSLNGATPQKIIRMMRDIIGRARQDEKDRIRIVTYREDFGHPFADPITQHRVVVIAREEKPSE